MPASARRCEARRARVDAVGRDPDVDRDLQRRDHDSLFCRPDIPFMPYKTITLTLFNRTLSHGLLPGGPLFLFWNYVAIGLVATALYAAFSIISAASWTYDTTIRRSKRRRRRSGCSSSATPSTSPPLQASHRCLAIETGFAAAASLFPEKIGEATNPTRILIDEIGGAIVQANGIGLGLALAASYFPAAGHLHDAYEREKAASREGARGERGRTGRHVLAARFRCVRDGAPLPGDHRPSADRADLEADRRRIADGPISAPLRSRLSRSHSAMRSAMRFS